MRQEVVAATDELRAAERKVELLEARFAALEHAASLRPLPRADTGVVRSSSVTFAAGGRVHSFHKGRQPGAISQTWRTILLKVSKAFPDGADERDIFEIARTSGLENVRLKDVKDRMADYRSYGYVEPIGVKWRVTELALRKFQSSMPDAEPDKKTADPETGTAVLEVYQHGP